MGTTAPGGGEIEPMEGQRKRKLHRAGPVSEPVEGGQQLTDREQTFADSDQTFADSDQSAADSDQTFADSDQSAADSDQTAADSDQAAADSDQAAADSDQAAADLDLARGGDQVAHEATRDIRDRSTRQRGEAAEDRVAAAAARDAVARARDRAAAARDQAASVRDSELATEGLQEVGALPAPEQHHGDVADRVWAAEFRARAAADREQAALDREQAARDRLAAETDREALLQRLATAETDELTGARTRSAGLADLEHEIARARRTSGPLATAYVDVVGLKRVNDAEGHSAGDALLQHAVRAIREHLRSYDLIVRMGGDEFLCVMSAATVEIARRRFAAVQAELAADTADLCEIKFGVAQLADEDSAIELVKRADAQLPVSRPA
jgi:diguanylate cyclase (GGDEF)-like protein